MTNEALNDPVRYSVTAKCSGDPEQGNERLKMLLNTSSFTKFLDKTSGPFYNN